MLEVSWRTEVTLSSGSQRVRCCVSSPAQLAAGDAVPLVDCDLPTVEWTIFEVHGARGPSSSTWSSTLLGALPARLGPETMAWFETWRNVDDSIASSLRVRRDADEQVVRALLTDELRRSTQVQPGDDIGPSRDRCARLAVWADVGGFTRTRLSYVFGEDNHGLRWLVVDALPVLEATPAEYVL